MHGVADIDDMIAIGIGRLQRAWRRAVFENIVDNEHGVADIDDRIPIGIAPGMVPLEWQIGVSLISHTKQRPPAGVSRGPFPSE